MDPPFDSGQGMKVSNNRSADVSVSKHLVQRETLTYMLDATKLQTMSPSGQDKPPDEGSEIMPSPTGRQRKKNSKYLDYETEQDKIKVQKTPPRTGGGRGRGRGRGRGKGRGRGRSRGRGRGRGRTSSPSTITPQLQSAEGEHDETVETIQDSAGNISEETPKKVGRPKKTPGRKPAAGKTVSADGLPAEEGGVGNPPQQENGIPKRKYTRKHKTQVMEPDPLVQEAQGEPQPEPEEETQPGGRRRRGAAKA